MLQDVWLAIDEYRYADAEELLRRDEDLLVSRAGQMALGYIYAHTERPDEAREVFARLREQHRGDDWEHIAVHQLGRTERLAGQYRAGLELLAQERDMIAGLDENAHERAVNALETGICYLHLTELGEARAWLQDALRRAERHEDPEVAGRAERFLGELALQQDNRYAAQEHFTRALTFFRESEDEYAQQEIQTRLTELEGQPQA
ncbi:hypothetical protein [Deinococcus radiophilus]|uniref:Tetratricopeptide repeat protein n=1 Tax=Deinococcus radiophilus TaxID=32062 RepID=A0A3S0IEL3_9DEIO|nr:hypothetical protein [Deinococcus radiophilus]RTR30790.1 hypothetical protein EJ104_00615 [Deinococcus radiophilus]UFA51346.1 hypothetical protein LMT64_05485 [Deinococcus radiophilus]